MKEDIEKLLEEALEPFEVVVSDVYLSNEENIKTLNIEIDTKDEKRIIDLKEIEEISNIINPIMDHSPFLEEVELLDIHSKSKGGSSNG